MAALFDFDSKKALFILHDKTHSLAAGSEYCETCGQTIKPPPGYGSGSSASNRIGIAISILLHVLVVVYYLTREEPVKRAPPPARESGMVYIAPLAEKPKPKTPPSQPQPAKPKPPVSRPKQAVAAITPPARPKLEVVVPPLVSPVPVTVPPPAEDMEARIAAARKRRADAQPQPEAEESESERALRVARANIAGAQGKNTGNDKNDSGGVFSIMNQTSHSAEIKFRGWNGSFKRNWLKQERVEQGAEQDIETAIVKKMIELIRNEKPGDFVWDSHRLGRHVPLSARVEDTAELHAFLLREFFPDYRRR